MKKTKGFGLLGIIIIIIITAIVSSVATGVIVLNSQTISGSNGKYITNDEELNNFIEIYNTIVSRYYDEIDREKMLEAAEEGMLNYLGDKYTTFLEGNEYESLMGELSETYRGIGIAIANNIIVGVTEDSPASIAGLKVNDVLIKINNTLVTDKSNEEISDLIKKSQNLVKITIDRNGEEKNFEVEIKELINPSVYFEKINNTEIGYLQITKFSDNLHTYVKNALDNLEAENINSLIIDVRSNVGGYLGEAEKTAELFLEKGKVIYSLETSSGKTVYKDQTKEKRNYEIMVLINETSASASEVLAAALKESYGATLLGSRSYGKGKVQQIIASSAKYTFAKWLTPNNVCIDGIGIMPDYMIINSAEDVVNNYDRQLNKAIELLNK